MEAGAAVNGGVPVEPEHVSLVYWFVSEPETPVVFSYTRAEHEAEGRALAELVEDIQSRPRGGFPLTEDERRCAYCVYRSLCDRGETAGTLDEREEIEFFAADLEQALEFTLDEVEELAF